LPEGRVNPATLSRANLRFYSSALRFAINCLKFNGISSRLELVNGVLHHPARTTSLNSGYYAACAGLKAQTEALEFIGNNLANINTVGYRAQQPTFRSFLAAPRYASDNPLNQAINDFSILGGTRLDLTNGNLQSTGNSNDVALEGEGFFVVQTNAGTMYTRNGNFQLAANGRLITSSGDAVLGDDNRPITLPGGDIAISSDGTLSSAGAVIGKLKVVDFPADTWLVPQGNSYYIGPDADAQPAARTYVRQGMLESSNVNPVLGMVNLISVQRHADMMQRALSAYYNEFNRVATSDLPRV
jgi:flagellar basal-body rod protein FlgF